MTYSKTTRTRLKRLPERGHYDKETVHSVLDAGLIAHVGIAEGGDPVVIPVMYGRMDNEVVFHGAKASRLMKAIHAGSTICVTVTLMDGLVLARSLFSHSLNYRSVVLFGRGRLIETDEEKLSALKAISEQMLPGRWDDARLPSAKELNATRVVAVQIEEASAKIRTGGADDEDEDYDLPFWAGVVPVREVYGEPEPDGRLKDGVALPEYLEGLAK